MIEKLSNNFIINPNVNNAINLLRYFRSLKLFNISIYIGEYMSKLFPYSVDIKDEISICSYYINNYQKSYDVHEKTLAFRGLTHDTSLKILFNQHFSINHICDNYIFYNPDIIKKIQERPKSSFPLLTLTITTCKRFDLFEKTINSVLNCVDIENIDYWLCVDDNSSEEDRKRMKEMYPFFTFYFKTIEEKGHPRSMNIIKNHVKTPYMLHLEDDWKFFTKRNYISDAYDVLNSNDKLGQCLFNKNYSEIASDIDIKGGFFHTTSSGLRYYIHEYLKTQEEKEKWIKKYGNCKSSSYWPHFSFRPSVIKKSIFDEIGDFNEHVSHFEMDYAYKYISKGYISAFFEGIYCLHTGRLTSERTDETKLNAYKLNDEIQFYGKEDKGNKKSQCKTYVVNLDRRNDRWEKFEKKSSPIKFLNYERFSAVDGKSLSSNRQIQQIFENNDYNMRKSMVGCFLSHIKLYIDLVNDKSDNKYILILEDDIDFVPEFENKYNILLSKLNKVSWDIAFLGHHVRDINKKEVFDKEKEPEIDKWDVYTSFINSLGSTASYMITKDGARKFLNFLNRTGATNGIDTCIQKACNELNIYYCTPHLIYSECYRGDNSPDSDIQYDYSSLSRTIEERLQDEIDFYKEKNINLSLSSYDEVIDYMNKDNNGDVCVYYKTDNKQEINKLVKICTYPFYLIGDSIIFINSKKYENCYYHRYKVNDEYKLIF